MSEAEDVCWISYTLEGIDYHPTEAAARAHVEAWTSRYVEANRRLPDESGWVAHVTADLVVEFDLVVRSAVGLQWVTLAPMRPGQAQEIERLRAHVAELEAEADGVARGVARYVTGQPGLDHVDVDPDRDLLRRALLALRPRRGEGPSPRWSLVRNALHHGSGVSQAICLALGIDPDEVVP